MRECTGQGVPSRCQGCAALGEGELTKVHVAVCVLLLSQIDITQVTGVLLNTLFSDETFQKAGLLVFVFN